MEMEILTIIMLSILSTIVIVEFNLSLCGKIHRDLFPICAQKIFPCWSVNKVQKSLNMFHSPSEAWKA